MKKNITLVLCLAAFAAMAFCNGTLFGSLIISCVVIISCLLASVIMMLINKVFTAEAKPIVAAILGAFFALALSIIAAAFVYNGYKMLTVAPAAIASAAAMATVYNNENASLKFSLTLAAVLAVVCVISGIIREVFGYAAIAGTSIDALSNARCVILTSASGALILMALILACIKKVLPQQIKETLVSDEIPFFMTSRFASKAVPEAFAGVPSLLLVLSIIGMVLYAYI